MVCLIFTRISRMLCAS